MRFLFIDVIDEFHHSESLSGRVSLPRTLVYPAGRPDRQGPAPSLLLEALAQAGGWLLKASRDFNVLAVMSVVSGFRYHRPIPLTGSLHINVRMAAGSSRLLGVTGTLSLPSGETVASVDSMLYVLIATEDGAAREWGVQAWSVLTNRQHLTVQEDVH